MLAHDGHEAVDIVRARRSERTVVLLDMMMPRLNREVTFRAIIQLAPGIPMILSGGYHEQAAISPSVKQVLTGFIQKTYGISLLLDTVEAAAAIFGKRTANHRK